MPDWSYHPTKKMLLNKLKDKTSREFIHTFMTITALLPGGPHLIEFLGRMKPPSECKKIVNDTLFSSPVGLSGLIDPYLSGTNAFQELGFGFIEIGPIVLDQMPQQTEPIKDHNRILFSSNRETVPLKRAINKLTHFTSKIPIFSRIDSSATKEEVDLIVHHLTPFIDAFIGTPEQFTAYSQNEKLSLRPFYIAFSTEEANLLKYVKQHPSISGVVIDAPRKQINNYWYEDENANERLIKIVKEIKDHSPYLVVITSGGVQNPGQGYSLLQAGTDLLMLTEGYVTAGPGLPKRIYERLQFDKGKPKAKPYTWSLLFGLSIFIGGLIALYFALTSIILSYDESFIGLTKADLMLISPTILSFMSHDRMALAGTMISGGILYIQLARHGLKYGLHWAKIAFHSAAIVGFLGILLFIGFGYFDWLHGLYWIILCPFYYFSFKESKNTMQTPASKHDTNDQIWMRALFGQLLFILLGFSIVVGGIVISTIGVSSVFVSTDLSYLCMTPDMLHRISERLIPVIAHDRAGFGSALISVGLLVLMLSLWGFRQGEKWVWNTIALGALPAFIAGIGTHFHIGYTTFIHLLPVYFLCALYVLGLILSYPFLKDAPS